MIELGIIPYVILVFFAAYGIGAIWRDFIGPFVVARHWDVG